MKIAIITGASSGMGLEFARQLALALSKTEELWLIARKKTPLEDTAAALTKMLTECRLGRIPKIRVLPMDITNDAQLSQFAEILMIQNASISVLINCAGTGTYGAFQKQSRDEVAETVRLNVLALTQITKFCLPYMRKGSKIIQVASGSAFLPQPDFSVYAASKAYVYSFGKALGKELKKEGISVTVVCPGPVDTPFISHAYGRYGKMNFFKKLTMVKPEKVVKKALSDSKRKKALSVYGVPMNLLYKLTRGFLR